VASSGRLRPSRGAELYHSSSVVTTLTALKHRGTFVGPEDLVFATTKGTPLDETNLMRRLIKPVAKELGMPWLSWHVFRHTHASLGE
jgi:integrase